MVNDRRLNKQGTRPFGFNVIGYVSRNLGLGVFSRNMVRLFLDHGHPVAIYDLNPPGVFQKRYKDKSFKNYSVKCLEDLPYSINFFTLPIRDATEFLFTNLSTLLRRPDSLNVFCPMWELDVLPTIWIKALQLCDVMVVLSDFVRSTCKRYLPRTPVLSAGHPVYFPEGIRSCRRRFGLPEGPTIFVFSFEPRSDIERKNPLGVLRAFQRAFPGQEPACLAIKVNNACLDGNLYPDIAKLKALALKDPRIHLIIENLSYRETLSLYASCDSYVSLHRSEGLGLGMMEAMQLGKPVIATGWSGNMTYMSAANSCLVRYKMIPAKGIIKCYNQQFIGDNAVWAEPDIDQAAAYMRRMVTDAGFRKTMARKASQAMARYQRDAKKASFVGELRKRWQEQVIHSDQVVKRRSRLFEGEFQCMFTV